MKRIGGRGARAFFAVVALTWAGCDSSAPTAALGVSGAAGASGSSGENEGDAGVGGSGVADSGTGGNVSTAGGPGDFEACDAIARLAPAAEGPAARASQLGLLVGEALTVEGQVSNIAEDRMLISTADGTLTFFWMGPSLDSAFSVGDAVQVVTQDSDLGAFGGPFLSIIRSEDATAAILDGLPITGLGKSPGSTRSLALSPGFPELVYGVECCGFSATGRGTDPYHYACDYSRLDTTFENTSVPVALGSTGLVGPWSVTNIRSLYTEQIELTWSLAVSLLGPATPRAVDGGT